MYDIAFDPATRLLSMRLEGFWDVETLNRFAAELSALTERIERQWDDYPILSDSRGFSVQSVEVTAGFSRIMEVAVMRHRGPVAIVVGSRLNKLQVERSMMTDHLRVFLDIDEARAWLREASHPR